MINTDKESVELIFKSRGINNVKIVKVFDYKSKYIGVVAPSIKSGVDYNAPYYVIDKLSGKLQSYAPMGNDELEDWLIAMRK